MAAVEQSEPNGDDTIGDDNAESDYGSDLDSATWDEAYTRAFPHQTQTQTQNFDQISPTVKLEDVEEPVLPQQDDSEAQSSHLRLARIQQDLDAAIESSSHTSAQLRHIRDSLTRAIRGADAQLSPNIGVKREHSLEVDYDQENGARATFSAVQVGDLRSPVEKSEPPPAVQDLGQNDTRSPLERFRTPPKKGLSVTDLVSPAWCELQYWYSLTKYGRIKRTPTMKQGSKIHKQKEQEVHTEIPVEVVTREDKLGLRMWNVIQGLRMLRTDGLTRELEVFGVIDDQVVIGIIDELSHSCPDEAEEAKILEQGGNSASKKGKKKATLPPDQTTMHGFLSDGKQESPHLNGQDVWLSSTASNKTTYLIDMKTRKSKGIPALGSQMRPTQMQLMLYRRLLADLAANKVEADRIFARYQVDSHALFSDAFIAALGAIDFTASQRSIDDANDEFPSGSQDPDPLTEILAYNTLSSLWSHMIAEFSRTIFITPMSSSLSPLLTAKFVASASGEFIGQQCFAYDEKVLDEYVKSEMQWWRGERKARGVEIEEAYKCGICEFAEVCEWRKGKIEEATKKSRLRKEGRVRSQV